MRFVLLAILASLFVHNVSCDATAFGDMAKILTVALEKARNDLLTKGNQAREQLEAFVQETLQKTESMIISNRDIQSACTEIIRDTKIMDQQLDLTNREIIDTIIGTYQRTLNEIVSYLNK